MKMKWLACLALVLGGCPSVDVDTDEGNVGPTVEFDPLNKIIPFPNNLLLDPMTGKVNLPEQCNEGASSAFLRTQVLNKLDGFGTYEGAINVTFTEPVDPASLDGNVLLFERVSSGDAVDPLTATPIPVVFIPGKTIRFTNQADIKNCTDPVMVDQVTIIPAFPLEQHSTFTVAVLDGVKTANGAAFNPSFTWSVVREPQPVVAFDDAGNVTLNRTPLDPNNAANKEQLAGIDLLWKAHHEAVNFLAGAGHESTSLLLAFEFNTQTTIDPLDASVAGTPAAGVATTVPLIGNLAVNQVGNPIRDPLVARQGPFAPCAADAGGDPGDTQCFLRVALGSTPCDAATPATCVTRYNEGKATCAAAGCAAIGTVINSILLSKQYQVDTDNTEYTGTGSLPIPGQWGDPVKPAVVHDITNANPLANDIQAKLGALVLLPNPALCPGGVVPAAGFPTVVFQHGITRSLGDVFGMAGGLTSKCFAVVAIDAVNHGSRAIRISNTHDDNPLLNCDDTSATILFPPARADKGPDPAAHGNCYQPVFSTDLGATRDEFRQSIVDQEQLIASLTACGTTACGGLKVDPDKIYYVGHSMGSIFGSITTGLTNIRAAVLNVSGAGWLDILENTDQVASFQCPLVDALIDAGILVGAKHDDLGDFDPTNDTGLCTTPAWKTQPGYLQFAVIARWVLDPADPANFNTTLAPAKFLIQRAENDEVVPNIATDREGALVQQLRADASCGEIQGPPVNAMLPSSALLADPTKSAFLNYITVPPGTTGCLPGNTFTHGTMLSPTGRCATTTSVICSPRAPQIINGCPNNEVCNPSADGGLATQRVQTDAIFWLLNN